MNYIKQLQAKVEEQQQTISKLEQGLQDLKLYVTLPKFQSPGHLQGYVSTTDVYVRLVNIEYGNDN
jgi:hypothetical protein